MANEKIIFDTEVKVGNSVGSVKSLKAELRAITNELATLEQGSEAFVNAAKKAGSLKDQIGDVKNTINAFNPEAKFKALGDAVGIAANGFAAVQGAMALFGSESEDLNKVIAQTQGAIALATGLNGLLGMKDAWGNLKLVAGDALKGIKAGIGATGIGLIVVAVGLLVANWDALSASVKKAFPIFNDMGNVFGRLKEMAYGAGEVIKSALLMPFKTLGKVLSGDFSGALEEIKKGYNVIGNFEKGAEAGREANRQIAAEDRLKKLIEEKEKELEIHKAGGKDTYKEELALNKLKQDAAKDNKEELEKLQQAEKVLIAGHKKDLAAKAKIEADQQKADAKKKQEEEEKLLEDKKKQQEEFISRTEKEYNDTNKFTDEFYKKKKLALIKSGGSEEEIKKQQQENDIKQLEQKIQNAKDYGQSTVDFELEIEKKKADIKKEEAAKQADINKKIAADETKTAEERVAALNELNKKGVISDKEASDAKIAIAQAEQNAKLSLLSAYGQTFNQIADLLGKSTAEGKAVAIAATTIDTYVAAFRAYKEGLKLDPTGTFSIIAAAAAAAVGIKAVQNIINTPVPGNSGGGGGGGGVTAPSAPRIPQSFSGAKLGGNSEVITRNNGQVQKVIVTETDITKTQNNVKNIVSKATIR